MTAKKERAPSSLGFWTQSEIIEVLTRAQEFYKAKHIHLQEGAFHRLQIKVELTTPFRRTVQEILSRIPAMELKEVFEQVVLRGLDPQGYWVKKEKEKENVKSLIQEMNHIRSQLVENHQNVLLVKKALLMVRKDKDPNTTWTLDMALSHQLGAWQVMSVVPADKTQDKPLPSVSLQNFKEKEWSGTECGEVEFSQNEQSYSQLRTPHILSVPPPILNDKIDFTLEPKSSNSSHFGLECLERKRPPCAFS